MIRKDLKTNEFNEFYSGYINKLDGTLHLREGLVLGRKNILDFFNSIPKDKLEYRYAEDKWTIKEIFQHIIDTERVFAYRCFTISRRDFTMLPGFEQNDYIEPSKANSKPLEILFEEYKAVRQNSIVLVNSLSNEDLNFVGQVNGSSMSSRAAVYVILGHEVWHKDIIEERYL